MSVDEAAKYYTAAVCPANKAIGANNAAFAAQDLASIKQSAATVRDAYRAEAAAFTSPPCFGPQPCQPLT